MIMRAFGNRKRRNEGRWLLAGLLMVTTALVMIPKAEAAGEVVFPGLAGGVPSASTVMGLSSDGRFAAVSGGSGPARAYHWNGTTLLDIGDLGGGQARALAISGDGQTIVGHSLDGDITSRAFIWRAGGGLMEDLGTLSSTNGGNGQAHAVDQDGSHVVGDATATDGTRAFAWIAGSDQGMAHNQQMYLLSTLDGAQDSSARGVTRDGRYAVGHQSDSGVYRALRWNIADLASGGADNAQYLGSLGGDESIAFAVSDNGRIVVGYSNNEYDDERAFRWVDDGGTGTMQNLGTLEGHVRSFAYSVSADGNVVVGNSHKMSDETVAYRWTEGTGMVSIGDWLEANGVEIGADNFTQARSVSADGQVVAGQMMRNGYTRSYIARVDGRLGTGVMDVEEYNQTLYAGAGGIAGAGEFLTWLPMNGAHHRPLMLTPELEGDMCAWATGDFAHHGGSSTGLALAEVGACTDLAGGSVRLGGAVGTTRSWQDLSLGGSSRLAGQYVLGEVDWQPDGTPLLLSVTGMLGGWQADVDRAYSNGAATEVSRGQTNAMGGVIRLRADWLEAVTLGNTTINPWSSLSLGALHVDGYTESGGPFPATFDAQNMTHVDVRLGLTAITEFSSQTKLSTTFEVAHRSGTAPKASGRVDGLFDFSLGGGQQQQTWVRVGAELDHKITDSVSLSTSVHLATAGRDPSIAGSVGVKGAF